jgi:hypothetical protein
MSSASQQIPMAVSRRSRRFRSKADLTDREPDFRFTPESRLRADIVRCPFRANYRSHGTLFDHLVSERQQIG